MDLVRLVFTAEDGETLNCGFTVDDYDSRLADGALDSYIEARAWPKVREWRPNFTETSRTVEYGYVPPNP